MSVWIDVIGIGEDGYAGLTPAAREALESAEIVIGGDRHHSLAPHLSAERVRWPSPFSLMTERILGYRGRRVVLLVTGDPLWYSAGARIARMVAPGEARFHPQISAFQLACARMCWSLADVELLTEHGRPAEQLLRYFAPGARLVILTSGPDSPTRIARLLGREGYSNSEMTVLGALGGPSESRTDGVAHNWETPDATRNFPAFHTLCVTCKPDDNLERVRRSPGLADDAFVHDGNITKREVRSVTLSALAPMRGELLWDIGAGSGTVAIEWMRMARDAEAICIEARHDRCRLARQNADALGAPRLKVKEGLAPEALFDLPRPNAVFVGGGLSERTVNIALEALRPFGRLVANAVTIESESLLGALQAKLGGELIRISVGRMYSLGSRRGWRQFAPVTQWQICV